MRQLATGCVTRRTAVAIAAAAVVVGLTGCPPRDEAPSAETPAVAEKPVGDPASPDRAADPASPPAASTPDEAEVGAAEEGGAATLREALQDALEFCADIHFEVTGNNAQWDVKIRDRERIWREDLLGDSPCVTAYQRGRTLLLAVARKLPDRHLHEWLSTSLEITQNPERLAHLRGGEQPEPARAGVYQLQGILEAAYNLARDPAQQEEALRLWNLAEQERYEARVAANNARLATLEQKESEGTLTFNERVELASRREASPEQGTIPLW